MDDAVADRFTPHPSQYGLLRHTAAPEGPLTPKPGYQAYAVMTRTLANATVVGTDETPDAVHSYVHDGPDGAVRVLWADVPRTRTRHVRLRTDGPITLTSTTGETRTLAPADGTVTLALSADPVYVQGAVEGIEAGAATTLSAPDTATGETIPVTATLDAGDERTRRSVSIGDRTVELTADPGAEASTTVDVPAGEHARTRTIRGVVGHEATAVGTVATTINVTDAVSTTVTPVESGTDRRLEVGIRSQTREGSIGLSEIRWSMGSREGTVAVDRTLQPGASTTVAIPTPDVPLYREQPVTLALTFEDRRPHRHDDSVRYTGGEPLAAAPVPRRSLTVDGQLEAIPAKEAIHLPANGSIVHDTYGGPDDLSGRLWFTYDEEHLYLAATVTDDEHATGWPLWEYDSIQLGVDRNDSAPANYSEFQIADSPDGPTVYRGYQPDGPSARRLNDVAVSVRRENATNRTVYEVAIPWDRLDASPEDDVRLSVLLNDNDGGGRLGWIEWAGGIGRSKDPTVFRPARFGTTGDSSPSPTAGTATPGSAPGLGGFGALITLLAAMVIARRR
jgi:hypothetical protein